jgi:glyoxylase-like metal-dependent hydrolase (beta-lactamase superfamily II)
MPTDTARRAPQALFEQVHPSVWRWSGDGGDDLARCGTALATDDGLVLVDPPALSEDARRVLEAAAGPIRHVVLTSSAHADLAEPFRGDGVDVWTPSSPPTGTLGAPATGGASHTFGPDDRLPGGVIVCELPAAAAPGGEVVLLWPAAGDGLLITGDVLPVVGQTPVYLEGETLPMPAYLDALRALLAADPGTLAPGRHGPFSLAVARSTAYAAHLGSRYHAQRAAPVQGPRFVVPQAQRVLEEALIAPVVLRRAAPGRGWIADPFACARCGAPNEPMRQTCGGPTIPRLCPACRALRRERLPAARVMVCAGGCCTREGARAVLSAVRQASAAHGLAETVDVVPVSCLGECSLGPFVRVSSAQGEEPAFAAAFRAQTVDRARRYAADEGEIVDDESELVLSRFAALVQPAEVERLVTVLAAGHDDSSTAPGEREAPAIPEARGRSAH